MNSSKTNLSLPELAEILDDLLQSCRVVDEAITKVLYRKETDENADGN
jgi:hypothetical protein